MDAGSLPRENAIGWIVAHCNTCSDREVYANELNKYYPVVARYFMALHITYLSPMTRTYIPIICRGFCSGITCSGETLVANLTGDNVTSEISQANIEKDSNTKFEVNLATIQLFNDKRKQVDDGCDKLVHR